MTLVIVLLPGLAFAQGNSQQPERNALQRSDEGGVLGVGTRRFWVNIGAGATFGVHNTSGINLRLVENVGLHFSNYFRGPAIALELQQTIDVSGRVVSPDIPFTIGARFFWDIATWRDYGVYVAPSILLGGGFIIPGMANQPIRGYFDAQIGAEMRFILVDRIVLSARLFNLELAVGDTTGLGMRAMLSIDLTAQVGITF